MILTNRIAHAVAAGEVSVAYRYWKNPRVEPGSTFRTVAGTVRVEAIEQTVPEQVDTSAAQDAGYASSTDLFASLRNDAGAPLWRITIAWAGPDPREALAEDTALSESDITKIDELLDRVDARTPWARITLGRLAASPGSTAAQLTDGLPFDTASLKRRIRTLKEHGLTRSLPVGYELSARGRAYLIATAASDR